MSKDKTHRDLHTREGIGSALTYRQGGEALLHQVPIEAPTIIAVDRGVKHAYLGGQCVDLGPGAFLAVPGGAFLDVRHALDRGGLYEARVLSFSEEIIADFFSRAPILRPIEGGTPILEAPTVFVSAFSALHEALVDADSFPILVAKSRAMELLAWVAELGVLFGPHSAPSLSDRIRRLIDGELSRAWIAAEVAREFAMSEATFHRHLSKEGRSFSSILLETRLSKAMTLVLATDLPIGVIADQVGYSSHSRFAEQFRRRFGQVPRVLRGRSAGVSLEDQD